MGMWPDSCSPGRKGHGPSGTAETQKDKTGFRSGKDVRARRKVSVLRTGQMDCSGDSGRRELGPGSPTNAGETLWANERDGGHRGTSKLPAGNGKGMTAIPEEGSALRKACRTVPRSSSACARRTPLTNTSERVPLRKCHAVGFSKKQSKA